MGFDDTHRVFAARMRSLRLGGAPTTARAPLFEGSRSVRFARLIPGMIESVLRAFCVPPGSVRRYGPGLVTFNTSDDVWLALHFRPMLRALIATDSLSVDDALERLLSIDTSADGTSSLSKAVAGEFNFEDAEHGSLSAYDHGMFNKLASTVSVPLQFILFSHTEAWEDRSRTNPNSGIATIRSFKNLPGNPSAVISRAESAIPTSLYGHVFGAREYLPDGKSRHMRDLRAQDLRPPTVELSLPLAGARMLTFGVPLNFLRDG